MDKQIGIIGLGKMGRGIALQLAEKGWDVVAYNRSNEVTEEIVSESENKIKPAYSYQELVDQLGDTKVIWIMVPSGDPVQEVTLGEDGLINYLNKGDYVIDAGNSFYKNSIKRAAKFKEKNINYVDCGVSGGPSGARNGACCMVGGSNEQFSYLEDVFKDVSVENGYAHFEGAGAGHFVKMVHNGIEYGMMQSIAEGFGLMKESEFNLDLTKVAEVYNHASVIESRLIDWLGNAYKNHTEDLNEISGEVNHSGEGEWTVNTAKEMGIPVDVIERSLEFRKESQGNPSYIGKIVSALRNQFGGHSVKE